jgi:phage gp16-like protein
MAEDGNNREQNRRRRDLAKIHIAKKQLGLDDETYREMLLQVAGVASAADLSAAMRLRVLAHMHRAGFRDRRGKRPARKAGYPGRPRNMDHGSRAAQLQKIEALLTVGGKPWAYANAMAQRICKVDRIEWVPDGQLYKVITALRMQAKREDWDLSGEK